MPVAIRDDARGFTADNGVTLERAPATFSKRVAAGAAMLSTSVFQAPVESRTAALRRRVRTLDILTPARNE